MALEPGTRYLVAVGCFGFALALTIVSGIFGSGKGGGMSPSAWFGWHPVLMVVAFGCLLPIGRAPYMVPANFPGCATAESRRTAHGATMALALLVALAGYLCIFMAHLPNSQFFGYDFKKGEWKEWRRIAHVWFGYTAIVLMVFQAGIGMAKVRSLSFGERKFRFHGQLGKAIMLVGWVAVAFAAMFWAWELHKKLAVIFLCLSTVTAAVTQEKPDSSGETRPLAAGTSSSSGRESDAESKD